MSVKTAKQIAAIGKASNHGSPILILAGPDISSFDTRSIDTRCAPMAIAMLRHPIKIVAALISKAKVIVVYFMRSFTPLLVA